MSSLTTASDVSLFYLLVIWSQYFTFISRHQRVWLAGGAQFVQLINVKTHLGKIFKEIQSRSLVLYMKEVPLLA